MVTSPTTAPGQLSSFACAPDGDAACGLEYAATILETGGIPDALSSSEAPKLSRAAGGQLISHAVLREQIDEAARVVATDAASAPAVQRVRQSINTLAEPPAEPIPSKHLNLIATLGGIIGTVLSMLPLFGVLVSPWIAIAVFGVGLGAYLLQLYNQHAVTKTYERSRSEHEEAILALLRRADELRAQSAARARQVAFVNIDAPATSPQQAF